MRARPKLMVTWVEVGLIAVVVSASAERAWVLWSQRYSPNPSAWVLQTAYPTIAACTQDLDQLEKNAREAKRAADRRALPIRSSCTPAMAPS